MDFKPNDGILGNVWFIVVGFVCETEMYMYRVAVCCCGLFVLITV